MNRIIALLMLIIFSAACPAQDLTIDDLYQSFNMRSIYS